jgi:hypothetical protein
MQNLNEHINRMKQLFGAQHGIIKPLVNEQDFGDEDDLINKYSDDNDYGTSDDAKNNTPQGPSQYKKNEPLFGDEGNEMINKPGSGKNIQSSVDMTIKNLTSGNVEKPTNTLYEDEDAYQILQSKIDDPTANLEFDIKTYGYFVSAMAKKDNYNAYDGLEISFELPFVVTSLEEGDKNDNLVSNIDRQVSGDKTKIKINAKIPESMSFFGLWLKGKTDIPSPLKEGEFNRVAIAIRFR